MSDTILINRYASRRLYNTQTSEYVTLDEIAQLIRDGNEVEIRDRKTGEDLTRQFLLQIITEQESRGENVLPVNVLTGLVRSYSTTAQGVMTDFLSKSYEVFSQNQAAMVERMTRVPGVPEAWQKQQAEIMKSMMAAWMPPGARQAEESSSAAAGSGEQKDTPKDIDKGAEAELADVKAQLAELMRKVDGL